MLPCLVALRSVHTLSPFGGGHNHSRWLFVCVLACFIMSNHYYYKQSPNGSSKAPTS